MGKDYLLTPGPTPLPPGVLSVMAQPIIHHRTPPFRKIFGEVNEGLKYVFRTKNDILTFVSSGTGAMQASVVNLLSPGDKVIVVKGGKFSERWVEICESFGIEVTGIDVEWGDSVQPAIIAEALKTKRGKIKAVFTTLCETSTGAATDIEAIAKIVNSSSAVLVLDAISALGGMDLQTDNWGIDIVIGGSQKGLMIPPGLSFVSVSNKAWELVRNSNLSKYYFDFREYRKFLEKSDTPFTPAITLIIALNQALRIIREKGLDNVLARHRLLGRATQKAMAALGLKLFPAYPADVLTAVKVPQKIDGQEIVRLMREKLGVTIAGGQGKLKGKIFRIAHMGYINKVDIIAAISALEMALTELGYEFQINSGVKAAEETLGGKDEV